MIDVIDDLNNTSMDVVTSIVSISGLGYSELFMSTFSIGMVFTRMAPTPPTVVHS